MATPQDVSVAPSPLCLSLERGCREGDSGDRRRHTPPSVVSPATRTPRAAVTPAWLEAPPTRSTMLASSAHEAGVLKPASSPSPLDPVDSAFTCSLPGSPAATLRWTGGGPTTPSEAPTPLPRPLPPPSASGSLAVGAPPSPLPPLLASTAQDVDVSKPAHSSPPLDLADAAAISAAATPPLAAGTTPATSAFTPRPPLLARVHDLPRRPYNRLRDMANVQDVSGHAPSSMSLQPADPAVATLLASPPPSTSSSEQGIPTSTSTTSTPTRPPLLALAQDLPLLFLKEVGPGRGCSPHHPPTHFKLVA